MSRDKIAVIIPCYNEALTIGKVIDDFRRELPEASVYVYDNNSTDSTARLPLQVVRRTIFLQQVSCGATRFITGST